MNIYRISVFNEEPWYELTRADAAKHVKQMYFRHQWPSIYVDLVSIPTNALSMRQLLNEGQPIANVLRSWEISARGGLKEVKES